MNIRRNIDYTEMYKMLDKMMAQQLPQMELYSAIGKAVCQRTEKGAAVIAAEYLYKHYPDVLGFSPRNVRRMRDFYRTYENHPKLRKLAMQIVWIQNVVIMEANLTMELREWYMRAARQFGWSKTELIANIEAKAHDNIILEIDEEMCYTQEKAGSNGETILVLTSRTIQKIQHFIWYWSNRRKRKRRWYF